MRWWTCRCICDDWFYFYGRKWEIIFKCSKCNCRKWGFKMWHFICKIPKRRIRFGWWSWNRGGDPWTDSFFSMHASNKQWRWCVLWWVSGWFESCLWRYWQCSRGYFYRSCFSIWWQCILWDKERIRKRYGDRFYPLEWNDNRSRCKSREDIWWRRQRRAGIWRNIVCTRM